MYLEKFKLDRKTALVTGAGQGIGLACAEALAEAGAKVVIADRDPKLADSGRASLKAKGLDAEIVVMDVTDSGRVAEVADELASRYGGIDILVNNAGIARSETPAEQVADEGYRGLRAGRLLVVPGVANKAVALLTRLLPRRLLLAATAQQQRQRQP